MATLFLKMTAVGCLHNTRIPPAAVRETSPISEASVGSEQARSSRRRQRKAWDSPILRRPAVPAVQEKRRDEDRNRVTDAPGGEAGVERGEGCPISGGRKSRRSCC